MFDAKVIRVFIASPRDASELRQIAKDVVETWNHVHSSAFGAILLPTLWETDASPGIGRAQTSINETLLDDSDLVIVIWRFLWGSGTQEEVDRSVRSSSREVLQYFSLEPVPSLYEGTERREQLRRYKDDMTRAGAPFYWTYNDPSHFRKELSRHLDMKIQRLTRAFISTHPEKPSISSESSQLLNEMKLSGTDTVLFSKRRSGCSFVMNNGAQVSFPIHVGDRVLGECLDNNIISRVPGSNVEFYITSTGKSLE